MNILVTGSAGFIGFNLSLHLIKKKYKVYGIDNFDDYYSIQLKKKKKWNFKKLQKFLL